MATPPALIRDEGETTMTDKPDDDTTLLTLDLPPDLAAQLEDLRRQFDDELIVDMLQTAIAKTRGKLALRSGYRR